MVIRQQGRVHQPLPVIMDILYSDPAMIILNKPAYLSVLPDGWEPKSTYLARTLKSKYGRVWVVHRLDKTTSGVMVFARTAEAHRALNMQFDRHEALKIYHAVIVGIPPWDEYTARHPLRADAGHKHRTVVDSMRGKPATTYFRMLERYTGYSLVEAAPETGRTHQIRAHLVALGYPILGDGLYGAPLTNLIARPALHAHSLKFSHPVSGESVAFNAPYPADFASVLEELEQI